LLKELILLFIYCAIINKHTVIKYADFLRGDIRKRDK